MKRLTGLAVLLAGCAPESPFPETMEARTRSYYSEHIDEAREMLAMCEQVEASAVPVSEYPATFSKNCIAARIAVARTK
ncbi:hypothetical protein A9995_14105 [Erythrobacter sp. QSSC1-22B]|uniref:hypothetical protein n=1 Tax=Erythrobacter sp. QSSC1-22B TaxID=1860125 RepID=UPI000805C9B9|nr:hypothetical protein [Erythrobacter sp. QSSC1-22B]OBX17928.1 hypothetical protein A9995_14105 [Erythrobacter sp. QSSC1-22B]